MKGQEGPNENLNNFEPSEKLSYILSVLGASRRSQQLTALQQAPAHTEEGVLTAPQSSGPY